MDNGTQHFDQWFRRATERAAYSGRVPCDELRDIGPPDHDFWEGFARFLLDRHQYDDACDAWDIALEAAQEGWQRAASLHRQVESWWSLHAARHPRGEGSKFWDLTHRAVQRLIGECGNEPDEEFRPYLILGYQWMAFLHDYLRQDDQALNWLAKALDATRGDRLDWSGIHADGYEFEDFRGLIFVHDYGDLTLALTTRNLHEAAGRALARAYGFGYRLVRPKAE